MFFQNKNIILEYFIIISTNIFLARGGFGQGFIKQGVAVKPTY
jgi:hypothetical protein